MKKITSVMMLAAAAAAALVSCNKEIEKPEVPQESEGIKVVINTGAPETKTYVEGTTPKWKATDAIGVFTGSDEVNVRFTNTKADGEAGSFSGSLASAGTYYAYYPYSDSGANDTGALVKIPEEQHPTPTSFDGAADILLSEALDVTTTGTQSIDARFKRLGGFLKFSFTDETTGKRLSGEYSTLVTVVVNNGDNRPCPSVRITPTGLGTIGSGMKTIKAIFDADTYQPTADGQATWFGVLPQTFVTGSTLVVTLTTTNYTITKTLTMKNDVTLGAGNILPIKVKIEDADIPVKVTKLWSLVSPNSTTSWFTQYLGGGANGDRNVAIDGTNVYVADFSNDATSKNIYAIKIAETTSSAASYSMLPNTTITTDGIRAVTCPRVVKKSDGTPVLIVSQLSNSPEKGINLYVYDQVGGIEADPRVVKLNRAYSSARFGDTFTLWGTYEKCMLFYHAMDGNGFVTFPFASGLSAASATLTDRINTSELNPNINSGFSSYHPFPDDISRGIANNRAFGRWWYIQASTTLWDATWGAVPLSASERMAGIWETVNTNAGTEGHNFIEFKGKRYVIYGCRLDGFATGYLVIKQGALTDDWLTIINKGISSTVALEQITGNGHTTGNGSGLDVAVWQEDDQVLIAIDMQDVGLAVYKMSL